MKQYDVIQALSDAGLRPSPVRNLIAKALWESHAPMSAQDLETVLETVDRSSISRAMSMFANHGFVHVVDDGSGSLKYELCHSTDSHRHDDDSHPHFHCVSCGETVCLDGMKVPSVALPAGYEPLSVNYVIKGLCPKCAEKK